MTKDSSDARSDADADRNGDDGTTPEQAESSSQAPIAPDSQEGLLLSLQDAQAKADEYWNELLRTKAELSNLQRRAERDVSNAHKYGLERFAGDLVPVIDSLELGLNAASEGDNPDPVKLREGMDLTLKLLESVAGKYGIRPIDPAGEKFNPERHQAMATQPAPGVEPNTVVTVYQKGWMLNDRLLRPAMVVVATAAPGTEAAPAPNGAGRDGGTIDEMA